jgi:integrase
MLALDNQWATKGANMLKRDTKLPGLYLRERKSGSVWIVKAKQHGSRSVVTVTLGRTDVLTPAQARSDAKQALAALGKGENPNTIRKRKAEAKQHLGITLGKALEEYLSLRQLKPSTVKSYRQVMQRAFGDWMAKPISALTRRDVLTRYDTIQRRIAKSSKWSSQANPKGLADAQKAMRYLSALMTSYLGDRYLGERLLPDGNPVLVLKEKRARASLKPRERFLNGEQRQLVFQCLEEIHNEQYRGSVKKTHADFVLLLLVTGLRINEARTLKWCDVGEETFTVRETKNKTDHTLPITRLVRLVLDNQANNTEYVFPGRTGLQPASLDGVVELVSAESGVRFTAHDLRRTAATIAAEHGFNHDQIAKLLNHARGTVTDRYVQRTAAALLPIMQAIEDAIVRPWEASTEAGKAALEQSNVVPFRVLA